MGSFLRLLRLLQLCFYVVSSCFYVYTSLFGRLFSDFIFTLHDRIYDGHLLNMRMVRSLSLSCSWEVNSHTDSSCHSDVKCRARTYSTPLYFLTFPTLRSSQSRNLTLGPAALWCDTHIAQTIHRAWKAHVIH